MNKEKMWVVNIDEWEHTVMPHGIVFAPHETVQVSVSVGEDIVRDNWFFQEVNKKADKKEEEKVESINKKKKGGK
jgi:hypothetical protein